MTQTKVVGIKEKKEGLAAQLESLLNEHAEQGWEFVEMEQQPGGVHLLVVFSRS